MPRQEDLLKLNERLPESARDILERADEFELMSVAPGATFKPPAGADVISLKRWPGSFRVIGRTRVGDATLRMKILAALYRGMADAEGMAGCFVPRHAIRAGGAGRKVELVICFHCSNVYGSAPGKEIMGFVTDSPQKLFDSVLTSAGVPLK
ncbi:MAG TPA: hypothetical protein VGX48_27095 [Pyrinomonadaceae bacterium]|jgi:hypothetical protein|nr:hypothetical protein [Pyrinomonadaceae bacterium]